MFFIIKVYGSTCSRGQNFYGGKLTFFKKLFWESVLRLSSKTKMLFHQYLSFFSHMGLMIIDADKNLKGS